MQRHAVAELPRVGDFVVAVGAGVVVVLRLVQRLQAVVAELTNHVAERLHATEGEARPLDEGARQVRRRPCLSFSLSMRSRAKVRSVP